VILNRTQQFDSARNRTHQVYRTLLAPKDNKKGCINQLRSIQPLYATNYN